jgi:hypothetical protein
LAAQRKNHLTNLRYGIGGGIALTVASILAIPVTAGLSLFTLVGGGAVTLVCTKNTGPLSEEEQLYTDIAARTNKILEKVS